MLSNTLSLRRPDGWTDEALDNASETIRTFFIVYDENKPPGAMEVAEAEAAEKLPGRPVKAVLGSGFWVLGDAAMLSG